MSSKIKKFVFCIGLTGLATVVGFCAYFECIPPPQASLNQRLESLFPENFNQWEIIDQDIAESPESSARISDFLNFDDAIHRIYKKDLTHRSYCVLDAGKHPRWAGAHTPDTCWILNGWTSATQHSVPFIANDQQTPEFGLRKRWSCRTVYFGT